MRLHPPPAAIAAVTALSLALPAGASATVDRDFFHPKGTIAAPTEFSSVSGCLDTGGFIFPFQDPGGAGSVFVEVGVFDVCADQLVSDRFGFTDLTPGDLTMAPDLTAAELTTTVPAFDGVAAGAPPTDPIVIDARWVGSGTIRRSLTRYQDGQFDGATIVNHDHEACRDAAAEGSVTSGGTDYMSGATADAQLCLQTAGSLFLHIEHP
jgi:hypothetical protein